MHFNDVKVSGHTFRSSLLSVSRIVCATGVGCADLAAPAGMTFRRRSFVTAVMTCVDSAQTFDLLCVDDAWTGAGQNCSSGTFRRRGLGIQWRVDRVARDSAARVHGAQIRRFSTAFCVEKCLHCVTARSVHYFHRRFKHNRVHYGYSGLSVLIYVRPLVVPRAGACFSC